MVRDRVRADVHARRDLGVAQSLGDQARDRLLGAGQRVPAGGRAAGRRGPVPAPDAQLAQPPPYPCLAPVGAGLLVAGEGLLQPRGRRVPLVLAGMQDGQVLGRRRPSPRIGVAGGGVRQVLGLPAGHSPGVGGGGRQRREPRPGVRQRRRRAGYADRQFLVAGGQSGPRQPRRGGRVAEQRPGLFREPRTQRPDALQDRRRPLTCLADLDRGQCRLGPGVDVGELRSRDRAAVQVPRGRCHVTPAQGSHGQHAAGGGRQAAGAEIPGQGPRRPRRGVGLPRLARGQVRPGTQDGQCRLGRSVAQHVGRLREQPQVSQRGR